MNRFSLERRTFLRGAGAALALPMLDAMRPALAAAAAVAGPEAAAPPVRLAWVFFPNGTNYQRWKPEGLGVDWKPGPTLEPLAGDLRQDVTIVSGLAHVNARSLGDGPGDHARSAGAFLTGAHPRKTSGEGMQTGKSADQFAAETYGSVTRLPSLELGTEAGRAAGACDSGYSCAYSNNISWRSPSQPMPKETNPRLAFERLFGGLRGDMEARDQRLFSRKSVLDMVAEDARQLRGRLGGADRNKVDEYFQSVRDIERRIERDFGASLPAEAAAAQPLEEPADIGQHIRMMYDLMTLAFRTDSTRIATFMTSNEGANKTYPMVDVRDGHHQLSHHQNDPKKIAAIGRIDRYLVEQFAYFVQKLKETPDGDGVLLDNMAVVYGGAISDGNRHDHHDLPVVVAGRGGGLLTPGRHIAYPQETPMTNLYLSMLERVGAPVDRIGDSTGPLPGLSV
ncbi:hypothetical protein Pla175_09880 [Pirellulimonas nuda]|uniref:DUF1552 domain-containing protein n=1 Tax=Pirellulimonas nuda TaxID=2528009 RepID=A0A518D836_9BACT|nr:DUF1552 domain-containing protein [Pirellulimonas nuda]QDU87623.1 hypothetical protein Pla175_09880 [Pirellulimonas nuda]